MVLPWREKKKEEREGESVKYIGRNERREGPTNEAEVKEMGGRKVRRGWWSRDHTQKDQREKTGGVTSKRA